MSGTKRSAREPVSPLAATVDSPSPETAPEATPAAPATDPTATPADLATAVTVPGAMNAGAHRARGTLLGRYVVVDQLGEGGMGIVYAAYDPELDRKLAVKLLRAAPGSDAEASRGRERLQREAQAMARLSHPNVIAVHDVGTFEDQVFVAMELVDGGTLRQWLDTPRSWREVVATFTQAARGLAAAHAAGIVHRDFKPDNVLLGKDGRVRVVDFGLAHGAGDGPASTPAAPSATSGSPGAPRSSGGLHTPLTEAGALLGTPRYMAPEQLVGHRADAKSDQFAFCVSLYEALYGELPFEGDDLLTLASSIRSGKVRAARVGRTVPAWLRALLTRGLERSPDARWPSMDAVVAALEADPEGARRRGVTLAAAAVGLCVAVAGIAAARSHRPPACPSAEPELAGVWDDARRQEVRAAFRATRKPFAEDALAGSMRQLDAYAAAWVAAHGEACAASRVRGEQSGELMDLRMACLQERLAGLRALTSELSHADGHVVELSFQAVEGLPALAACADVRALRAPAALPADPAARQGIEAVRERIAEARAIGRATTPRDGLTKLDEATQAAQTLRFGPLQAELLEARGELLLRTAELKPAIQALEDAVLAAEASRHESLETQAWIVLTEAYAKDENPRGAEAAQHAHACLAREGSPDDGRLSVLLSHEGELADHAGHLDEAIDLERKSIAAQQRLPHPDPVELAVAQGRLGNTLVRKGDAQAALEAQQQALAGFTAALGPEHPAVARTLSNLANALTALGRGDEAIEDYRKALSLKLAAFGDDTIPVADTLGNLGLALTGLHRWREALEAEQRALAIRLRRLEPHHPDLATNYSVLIVAQIGLGRADDALDSARKRLAIDEANFGADSPELAGALTQIGQSLMTRGDDAAALPYLERGERLAAPREGEPEMLADTRASLARALLHTHRDPARARRLAAQAREGFVAVGSNDDDEIAKLDADFPPGRR